MAIKNLSAHKTVFVSVRLRFYIEIKWGISIELHLVQFYDALRKTKLFFFVRFDKISNFQSVFYSRSECNLTEFIGWLSVWL